MNKALLIILIFVVLIAALWVLTREQAQAPVERPDTTSVIQEDVANIDLGDLDAEFQEIDSQINQL